MPVIQHGAHGIITCFTVTQHRYVGFPSEDLAGYVELLEIHDPPPQLNPIVIYRLDEGIGGMMIEFESVDTAMQAFNFFLMERAAIARKWDGCRGSISYLHLPKEEPWFYAVDRSHIKGRIAVFPPATPPSP